MSLRARFTALLILGAAAVAALIVVAETVRSVRAAEAEVAMRLESALRGAAALLEAGAPGVEAAFAPDGAIEAVRWSAPPAFADHAVVDRVQGVSGAVATVFVLDGDGEFRRMTTNVLKPDGSRAVGTVLGVGGPVHPVMTAGGVFRGPVPILGQPHRTIYQPIHGPGGVEGILFVGVPEADVAALRVEVVLWVAGVALLAIALAAPVAWAVAGRATAGLSRFERDIAALAAGDLAVEVAGRERPDEVGVLARALDTLRGGLAAAEEARIAAEGLRRDMLEELERSVGGVVDAASAGDFSRRIEARFAEPAIARLAEGVNRICETNAAFLSAVEATVGPMAQGDLTHRVAVRGEGAFARVADALNAALDQLTRLVGDVQGAAAAGQSAIAGLDGGVAGLVQRAESQAAALEQTAAAMTEMAEAVSSNAGSLQQAETLAREVTRQTGDGAAAAEAAVGAVGAIKRSADRIGEIVALIEGIAFQTNLLALNASVEAARAGDAGRGFAVVATEVRQLAQRSADAARDIGGLVSDSAASVAEGLRRVDVAGRALTDIRAAMERLDGMIVDLSTAGREQAAGVGGISGAVAQMDRNTQESAALTERFARDVAALRAEMAALSARAAVFATRKGPQRAAPPRAA